MITHLKKLFVSINVLLMVGVCVVPVSGVSNPGDAELHYSLEAELIHVDNLYLSSDNEVNDLYLVLSPGIEISSSNKGAVSYSAGYTHHFKTYRDNSENDSDFSDFSSRINYNSGVVLASAHLSYEELATNTVEVNIDGDLVEWDRTLAGGGLRYEVSDLTAMRIGLDYSEIDYVSKFYTDVDSVTVPLDLFYSIRPKVDLTAGARYRTTDTYSSQINTYDYEDMFYYVGAVGELFSPKFYGDFKYGYQTRDYKRSNRDQASSSYDMSVVYTADPKTSVFLTMSRDFRTSAIAGMAYTLTDLTIGTQYSVSKTLSFSGAVALGEIDYEDTLRAEDITRINLGTTYRPNDYLSLRVQYLHTDVDGNNKAGASNYEKNEFRVSASVRY